MRNDIRKTDADNKIMSFHIKEEDTQDPEMDRFVRESLIREADELEKKLDRKPELDGIEAPEGLFKSIVEELKERGVWEEETAVSVRGRGTEAKAETGQTVKRAEEIGIGQGMGEPEGTEAGSDMGTVYAQLPEEDQKALALGRELVRKQETRTRKRRHRRKILKISVIAAACLGVVFGVSMTSAANRRLVKRMWDGLMSEFGYRVNTDYVGDEETVRSKSKEETAAIEEIHEKTGAPQIYFGYFPEGMRYENYEIMDGLDAVMSYLYQDSFFYVTVVDADREGTYYYTYDKDATFRETIINDIGTEAKVWETNLDIAEEAYIAEIEYQGWRYILNGIISLEEMRKIVKNILFL